MTAFWGRFRVCTNFAYFLPGKTEKNNVGYSLSTVVRALDDPCGGVTLVAVSKTHPAEMIREAYDAGHRIFGESRPQELREKYEALPKDIEWHMIGHLKPTRSNTSPRS